MPVLLLARGDPQAKDLLRRAIEARYGFAPPAIDSLKIDFKGRIRARVGPITTWVPVELMAQFRFPNAMRMDFVVRPIGVTVTRGVDGFDGTTYRIERGGSVEVIDNADAIRSLRSRLWAIAAVLLTPLGDHFVELKAQGENQFTAVNTLLGDNVQLQLHANYSLQQVEVRCINPDSNQEQLFSLRLSGDQTPVDDLMLPCKVSTFWDNSPYFEVEPVHVESNPTIADEVFSLQSRD